MEAKNQFFFHIQKARNGKDNWRIGEEVIIEKNQKNNFYEELLDSLNLNIYTSENYSDEFEKINYWLKKAENQQTDLKIREHEYYLKKLIDVSKKLKQFSLELVFEQTRLKSFPDLPSRLSSIWLCEKQSDINFWDQLLKGEKKYFKLKTDGIIFKADARFVDSQNKIVSEFEELSYNYWSGEPFPLENEREPEILFQGKFYVIEELSHITH
jgi:hypothetical protein